MNATELGNLLRQRREERKFKQEEVGQAVGVSKQMISRYEKGSAAPSPERLTVLCEFLGLSPLNTVAAFTPPTPPSDRSRLTVTRAGARGIQFMSTERIAAKLRELLPDALRSHCLARFVIEKQGYRFAYASRRVTAHIVLVSPLSATELVRMRASLWRIVLVQHQRGNDVGPSDSHYLLAAVPREALHPNPDDTDPPAAEVPALLVREARTMDILVEAFDDLKAVAARVIDLEDTPTEWDASCGSAPSEDFDDLV